MLGWMRLGASRGHVMHVGIEKDMQFYQFVVVTLKILNIGYNPKTQIRERPDNVLASDRSDTMITASYSEPPTLDIPIRVRTSRQLTKQTIFDTARTSVQSPASKRSNSNAHLRSRIYNSPCFSFSLSSASFLSLSFICSCSCTSTFSCTVSPLTLAARAATSSS
jgi:hypothetical protein